MSDIGQKRDGFGIGEAGQAPASSALDALDALDIQPRPRPDYPQGRVLACGCTVYYRVDVMSASLGSSCERCYDDMS